jgi:hypothetical protein
MMSTTWISIYHPSIRHAKEVAVDPGCVCVVPGQMIMQYKDWSGARTDDYAM